MAAFLTGRVNDSYTFNSQQGDTVELIEIGPDHDGCSFRRNVITETFSRNWIENDFGPPTTTPARFSNSSLPSESLKLFFSVRQGKHNGDMLPIPMNKDLFRRVAPYIRLPNNLVESLHYKAPFYMQTTSELPVEVQDPRNRASHIRDEYLSVIIHPLPATSQVCSSVSFTYHFKTRRMYMFMHGLESSEMAQVPEWLRDGAARETFFLVPNLLLNRNLEASLAFLNDMHETIYRSEQLLGVRNDGPVPALTSIDSTALSVSLNSVTTNLAFCAWQCKTNVRTIDFLDKIARQYRVLAIKNGHEEADVADVERVLLETQNYLRCWNLSQLDRVEYLSKRGQALVQTLYSAIAQRDSAHSLGLAATSTDLSKISYKVAIATSRDSALMRIIAAITVVFLPATFTATFFSTSFFDFHVGPHDSVYSWWLWLYFLVTGILTAVTIIGTWMLWREESRTAVEKPEMESTNHA